MVKPSQRNRSLVPKLTVHSFPLAQLPYVEHYSFACDNSCTRQILADARIHDNDILSSDYL